MCQCHPANPPGKLQNYECGLDPVGGDWALAPRKRARSTIAIFVAQYAPQLTPCMATRFLSIPGLVAT